MRLTLKPSPPPNLESVIDYTVSTFRRVRDSLESAYQTVSTLRKDHDNHLADIDAAWIDFTPQWTNLTVGSAAQIARYKRVGSIISGYVFLPFAGDTTISGNIQLEMPTTPRQYPVGSCYYSDAGTRHLFGALSQDKLLVHPDGGLGAVNDTSPWTWAINDVISVNFVYEEA